MSIVIPTYNGQRYISDTIKSVLSQNYSNMEIIICDDASSDNTINIIREINSHIILIHAFKDNTGLAGNLNRGVKLAKGDYICWLNQDDIFEPDKIKRQVNAFAFDPELGAVFCKKRDIDEYSNQIHLRNPSATCLHNRTQAIQSLFKFGCFLCAPSVMIKKEVFLKLGYFNEQYKMALDLDMWLRILSKFSIQNLDEYLYRYRHHSGNLTATEENRVIAVKECLEIYEKAINHFSITEIVEGLKDKKLFGTDKVCVYSYHSLLMAMEIKKDAATCFHNHLAYAFAVKALHYNHDYLPAYDFLIDLANGTQEEKHFIKKKAEKVKKQELLFLRLKDNIKQKNFTRTESLTDNLLCFNAFNNNYIESISSLYAKHSHHTT